MIVEECLQSLRVLLAGPTDPSPDRLLDEVVVVVDEDVGGCDRRLTMPPDAEGRALKASGLWT